MIEPREISNSRESIIELVSSSQVDQNNKNKIKEVLLNGTISLGNGAALSGNILLWWNSIIPTIPAACLIADISVASSTSVARTVMATCNIENKVANKVLTLATLATAPLLPAAVYLLNTLPLNPELSDVWGYFIPAAALLTGSHALTAGEEIAKLCDNEEQLEVGNFRKFMRNASSVIVPKALGLIAFGMWNMYQHVLADAKEQEEVDAASQSFIPAIVGMGLVGVTLSLNTISQIKNYFASRNETSNVIIEEQNDAIEVVIDTDLLQEQIEANQVANIEPENMADDYSSAQAQQC